MLRQNHFSFTGSSDILNVSGSVVSQPVEVKTEGQTVLPDEALSVLLLCRIHTHILVQCRMSLRFYSFFIQPLITAVCTMNYKD